jgi:membrane protein implicated in regulation of membrane protease activity
MHKLMALLLILNVFLHTSPAIAYIGPGAGILLLGPMFTMLAAVGVAILMLLLWPLMAIRRKRKTAKKSTTDKDASAPPK